MDSRPKKKAAKRKAKIASSEYPLAKNTKITVNNDAKAKSDEAISVDTVKVIMERYPVLRNEELVKKFLDVPMTNNQKGRIRQLVKDHLKGTPASLLPDVIHNKIQAILKSSGNLTNAELRKVRVLYNFLKTAIENEKKDVQDKKSLKAKSTKIIEELQESDNEGDIPQKQKLEKKKQKLEKKTKDKASGDKKEKSVQKVKGPKRYVVFLGNLPLDVTKEMIIKHFAEMSELIKDIRIPKHENKKSCIAFVELANEASFELSFSKHHSMMGNKRINVQYTTQKNGKITKEVAKGKSSKLLALQKAGQLIGSIPMNKKRSFRRKKMKEALAKQNKDV